MSDEKAQTEEMKAREAAVTDLCIRKCTEMDAMGSLKNHKTGWRALKALPEPHKSNLKKMGYVTRLAVHRAVQPKTLAFTQLMLNFYAKHATNVMDFPTIS